MSCLSFDELNDKFRTQALRDFPVDTVLTYSCARKVRCGRAQATAAAGGDGDDIVWVVGYETTLADNQRKCGDVYIPARYGDKLTENPQGLILYKGMSRSSSTGNQHYVLEILSPSEAQSWVARLCKK